MSDMRNMSEGRGNSEIMSFIAGAVVGAAAALLLAPYTGSETRRRLGETARRVQDNAKNTMHDVRERIGEVKDRLGNTADHVREAVAEGRDAYVRTSRSSKPAESPLSRENV